MSDLLSMSPRELSRAEVMQQLKAKRITQRQAAEQLGLSVRQVKRLWQAYRAGGAKALISKRRGRPSNHQLDPQLRAQALRLVRERYADFGPTLAHEKLTEVHHLALSVETVRQLMTGAGLWQPRRAKRPVYHPLRARRPRRGELVQIDGSPFAWFEDRGPACSLLVYIDDATGELLELSFTPTETTFAYFAATHRHLERVRQQFRGRLGRAAFVALDFAQGGEGAAGVAREFLLGQAQQLAALVKPLAEGDGRIHTKTRRYG